MCLVEVDKFPKLMTACMLPAAEGMVIRTNTAQVVQVLKETKGMVGGADGAAARLGLKRTTLQARMRKYNIARLFQEAMDNSPLPVCARQSGCAIAVRSGAGLSLRAMQALFAGRIAFDAGLGRGAPWRQASSAPAGQPPL
jgi:hypothetical protein